MQEGSRCLFTASAALLVEQLSYRFVMEMLADGTSLMERFGGYYGATHGSPLVVAIEAVIERRGGSQGPESHRGVCKRLYRISGYFGGCPEYFQILALKHLLDSF